MPKGSQNGCIVLFCCFFDENSIFVGWKNVHGIVLLLCVLSHVLGLSTLFGFDLHHFSFPYLSLAHQDIEIEREREREREKKRKRETQPVSQSALMCVNSQSLNCDRSSCMYIYLVQNVTPCQVW